MLTVKKDVYVKKKFFFPQEAEAADLDAKKYVFQAKTKMIPDYGAIEREVMVRRGPTNQKEDPNYLFSRLNDVNKIKATSKRQQLQGIADVRVVRAKRQEPHSITPTPHTALSKFKGERPKSRRNQSQAVSCIYLNNSVFQPRFRIRDLSQDLLKKISLKIAYLQ